MTKGEIITAKILPANNNAKIGKPFMPVANKSTAPVAKINTGNCMGNAIKGTSTAPFFNDKVKLLAIADKHNKIGLPTMIDTLKIAVSFTVKPNNGIAKNAKIATIPALVSQCTTNRTHTHNGKDARETTS